MGSTEALHSVSEGVALSKDLIIKASDCMLFRIIGRDSILFRGIEQGTQGINRMMRTTSCGTDNIFRSARKSGRK